ncbi:MAG: aminotransferase [Rhodospirillaceae bacterium]|jgi:N-succinyldiaminopimelate aminotransferase|nr:aminotransferase [Rhodospirillaceae bacterium]MBT5242840.1 aminotransferase [Rhodospirillaceae bacterium]MBT5561900.1 aminotransferase [Rhodospirillaceae bacterium]MBT6241741.1 aminotransferase [Rhodospirillaceae bacterium]MBT7137636.1 aminotransferase [Rhodospirillaceae bacterium]
MKQTNSIMSSYGTTVFTVMSQLATDHGAINLGQGFPDQDGPADIREVAARAMIDGPNQYPPMMGMVELRQAVATANKRFYDLDVDWQSQVMVTSGATEAIADCLLGLINPGDEVVMIEPLYDCYLPMVQRAGGIAKLARIEPPDWTLPRQQLEEAFSDKTKLILLNSPHNPAGKVFDADELAFIAALVEKHDAYAVCDEVYEHLLFDGRKHIPLMTLPGMAERCLRIGSAGKTFSLTGWKIGYITGDPALISTIAKTHQFNTFTTPPGTQLAAAFGLAKGDDYFTGLAADLQARRDQLSKGLQSIGFETMESEGTYFLTVDFRPLGFNGDDVEFCRHITTEAGVAAVPVSAFYSQADVDHFARFCFCKGEALLDQALEKLSAHFST